MGGSWVTRTVLGIVLATFLSDFSHEMCTAVLPLYLATLGLGPAALGLIEGSLQAGVRLGRPSLVRLADKKGHQRQGRAPDLQQVLPFQIPCGQVVTVEQDGRTDTVANIDIIDVGAGANLSSIVSRRVDM